MNTLRFKVLNRKKYNTVVIGILICGVIYGFVNLISILRAFNTWSISAYVYLGVLFVFLFLIMKLRSVFSDDIVIDINEQGMTIKKNREVKSITHQNIVMIRLFTTVAGDLVYIYAIGKQEVFFKFESSDRDMISTLFNNLELYQKYTITNRTGKLGENWTEYINKNAVGFNANMTNEVRQYQKRSNKKLYVIIGVVLVLVLLLPIIGLFISDNEYYEEREGQMYYGDALLVGVNPDAIRRLDVNVMKDSTHVYYKDQVLTWADRPTFRYLKRNFFSDKNGVYYETNKMFGNNEIKSLDKTYDKATFHALEGSFLFKDKNHIYHIKASMSDDNYPLAVIEAKGLDVASFEVLNDKWAKDKGQVYFMTWENLRICTDIDPSSFEIIDYTVAKDKNYVYYLSKNLKSDNVRATNSENYAILEGADAPTFEKIDNGIYQDKNTQWSIEKEGSYKTKESTEIRDREDVE
ncbi:MAG: DKNYY domain-containing protein [Flavobacterium sp.]